MRSLQDRAGFVAVGAGTTALVLASWSRLRTEATSWVLVVASLAVVVAVVTCLLSVSVRGSRRRQQDLAARAPGWRLHEVWSDATMRAELARIGTWDERLSVRGGTRLTLGWSPGGVALWRGRSHEVVAVPWSGVAAVTTTRGSAASTPRPAVALQTTAGGTLVVVPCARPSGGWLPASAADVERLVRDLRAVRDAG